MAMSDNRYFGRYLRQRISRRRLLQTTGGTALGAAGVAVVGCGDGGGSPSGSSTPDPAGTPRPGGIIKLRQINSYANFNPFGPGISALIQGLFVGFALYDHLWYVPTDTGEVIPFLADEIETIDPLTIRVTMHDAVFHDKPPVSGRPVRSTDLKASMEKFAEQVPFGFSWLQEVFDHADTPDDKTIVYHQKQPWAWFFTSSNAGSPWTSSIIPEEVLDNQDILDKDPIGSGKWVLAGHDGGTNVKLRKFTNWREAGRPYVDGVDYIFAPDPTLAQAAFGAKDIDRIADLNNIQLRDLENRFGDEIYVDSDLSRRYRTLMLKHEPPFDNPDVVHGINLAINREEIKQVLNLGDGELCGPLPPAHTRFVLDDDDPDLVEYFRHDPQDARLMLEAAAFPFDQEFELKYWALDQSPDLVQVIARQLREVGVKVSLPGAEDLTAWLSNTLGVGNFQMTAFTHLPYEDPSLPLSFYKAPNFMGYENSEVEAAYIAAAEEFDEEARIEKTKEAQRAIIRNWGPQLNLYSPRTFAATWDYYQGQVLGRGSYGLFNSGAWLDN